ncbi:MFS transporter [Plasticicumulans acidivorans]|uniref:YNFM family putative membrane transporter n=1 Tax=Plasticicumulans acidivorans TaxID=886464 RepID=A0A317MW43_9GAMM|nr:MFS transporter [Plasticicumulans acidivorans]PWV63126.1 YNFM family putative membrane transporter [Plasticicumulans acidivorans]
MSTQVLAAEPVATGIVVGTPAYRRLRWSLFIGGFSTFALLHCVQPLLPLLSHAFALSPAQASVALSAATASLALSLVIASALSDRFGRRPLMIGALLLSAALAIASGFASGFSQLVLLRALEGIALAGLPAVAMAYLSEEMEPSSLAHAMGVYIAGSAVGGMSGRMIAAWLAEWWSWQVALGTLGVVSLLAALAFWWCLPASRGFRARSLHPRVLYAGARAHLTDAGLPWLYALAFLLMGCFVSAYNYLGYRLQAPPFALGPGVTGLIFALYMVGSVASTGSARLSARLGRARALLLLIGAGLSGLLLMLSESVAAIVLGLALFNIGFFGAHATASSWVGRRAQQARGLAAALYLTAYYAGASLLGTFSGLLWHRGGWAAVVGVLAFCLLLAAGIAVRLWRLESAAVRGAAADVERAAAGVSAA